MPLVQKVSAFHCRYRACNNNLRWIQGRCHWPLLRQRFRGARNPWPPLPSVTFDETVGNYLAELRSLAKRTSLAQFTHERSDAESSILAAMLALGVQSRSIQHTFCNIVALAETVRCMTAKTDKSARPLPKLSACPSSQQTSWASPLQIHSPGTPSLRCLHVMRPQRPLQRQRSVPRALQYPRQMREIGHYARICRSSFPPYDSSSTSSTAIISAA